MSERTRPRAADRGSIATSGPASTPRLRTPQRPVNRSAVETAYLRLREMIVDLTLRPGTAVNESSLAARLGIGRTPIHEALARLAAERFVAVLPRRGSVVATIDLDDVLDLFEAREAIECGVAYIAATRATSEDLAQLRTLIEHADQARHGAAHEGYLRDDHAIHGFLIHMINNAPLRDAGDLLLQHSERFWRWHWQRRPPRGQAMHPHQALLDALEAHDPMRASEAMREHIRASRGGVNAAF